MGKQTKTTKTDNQDRIINHATSIDRVVNCPECETKIIIPVDLLVGDVLECDGCGLELEILGLNPVQVAVVEDD